MGGGIEVIESFEIECAAVVFSDFKSAALVVVSEFKCAALVPLVVECSAVVSVVLVLAAMIEDLALANSVVLSTKMLVFLWGSLIFDSAEIVVLAMGDTLLFVTSTEKSFCTRPRKFAAMHVKFPDTSFSFCLAILRKCSSAFPFVTL